MYQLLGDLVVNKEMEQNYIQRICLTWSKNENNEEND